MKDISKVPMIILVGGHGSRMGSATKKVPKTLLQVKDWPILQWIVIQGIQEGVRRFVLPLGYKGEQIRNWCLLFTRLHPRLPISFDFIETGLDSSIAKRIWMCRDTVKSSTSVILANGDTIHDAPLAKMFAVHQKTKATATMLTVDKQFTLGMLCSGDEIIEGVRSVSSFSRKMVCSEFFSVDKVKARVFGGISLIKTDLFDCVDSESDCFEQSFYNHESVLKGAVTLHNNAFWCSFDTPKDLQMAVDRVSDGSVDMSAELLELRYKLSKLLTSSPREK